MQISIPSFFKHKEVVIDCYVDCERLAKNHPIDKGAKYVPKWLKQLPPTYSIQTEVGLTRPVPTLKKCVGFLGLYKQGWVITAWSDILIKTRADGSFVYEYPYGTDWSTVETHSRRQFDGAFKDYIHLKLISPWKLVDRNETNTKFLWTPTSWSLFDDQPEFRVLPGIVDFTNNIGTHLNFLLPKADKEYFIKAGTPLVHISPLTEKKVSFEIHSIPAQELLQLSKDKSARSEYKFIYEQKI